MRQVWSGFLPRNPVMLLQRMNWVKKKMYLASFIAFLESSTPTGPHTLKMPVGCGAGMRKFQHIYFFHLLHSSEWEVTQIFYLSHSHSVFYRKITGVGSVRWLLKFLSALIFCDFTMLEQDNAHKMHTEWINPLQTNLNYRSVISER